MNFVTLFGNTIHDYLEKADKSLISQNYYQAVEYFNEALDLNTSDIKANRGLSDSFFMLGEYDEALLYIDKCISLDKNDIELFNVKGRILTALENYHEAEQSYRYVLDIEMYNVGGLSGLAELRIVDGDLKGSLYDFEKILIHSPNSRRLLLSLVVLYDSQKEYSMSDDVIQKAIRIYPQDPIVLEAAVRHYMETKSFKGASLYMDELITLSEKNEIKLLQAKLLIYLDDLDESLNILTEYIKLEKDNPEAYYIASVILDKTNEKERALSLIKRGMDLKPDEEVYRFYSEMIMNDWFILKNEKRNNYSEWYYEQGKLLESRYYYDKAKIYYQRGMELNPFNQDLRIAYAGILKKMGYRQKYIKELELIIKQDSGNEDIIEILMIEKSLPKTDLYEKWGGEKWSNDNLFSVSTFVNSNSGENHLNSSNIMIDISNRFLSGQSRFYTDKIDLFEGNFSVAFNSARKSDSDYFVIINFLEGSRTFSLQATLHLTKSGRNIRSFNYLKTGNNRIFNCFENLSKDLNNFFPIIGSVIDIKNDEVLIDIGRQNSVEKESKFDIIKKNSYTLIPDEPYVSYEKERHLGSIVINDVGEAMSDGVFTADSSFNLLNIGDNVLYFSESEVEEEIESDGQIITDSEVIQQLLQVN